MNRFLLFVFALLFLLSSCNDESLDESSFAEYPNSILKPIAFPKDNLPNRERLELGERLFFDPILSRDSSISCASCHKREFTFADNVAFSSGFANKKGNRNSPVLINLAWQPYFLSEGGVPTLEKVFLVPFHEESEMNSLMSIVIQRMERDKTFNEQIEKAYPKKEIPFAISRALAVYMRSLVSYNSNFDKFYYQKDETAISETAKKGWKLFQELKCIKCHSLPNFTDYKFYNIGTDSLDSDQGRFRIDSDSAYYGAIKTPTLRNIGFSSPYMHLGNLKSIDEVIEFYNTGGFYSAFKSKEIAKLQLTANEKLYLKEFLNTLNDSSFISR